MTIETLKQLLQRYNLRPNHVMGQNFLLNEIVLQDIVDSAPWQEGDAAVEVGPGIGNLTERLLKKASFVLAIEKDKYFLPVLKALKKDHPNLRFEISDILAFDFQAALIDYPRYHVVANIPYYITGKIIPLFVRAKHKPQSVTLLVQKEVAQNATAQPGNTNLLSLSVQLFGEAKILQKVLARDFYPSPKVDSAVLQIIPYAKPRYDIDEQKFFRIARACFAGKRKQLHNTLVNNLKLPKDEVMQILSDLNIPAQTRPQELSLDQWVALSNRIKV